MEQKVKEIIGKVFGVDPMRINENTTPETVDNWDSLKHMVLILAIEEELGVEIPDDKIGEITGYTKIVDCLKELIESQY